MEEDTENNLCSAAGIHLDPDTVMISTPLDKYEADVYELVVPITQQAPSPRGRAGG